MNISNELSIIIGMWINYEVVEVQNKPKIHQCIWIYIVISMYILM